MIIRLSNNNGILWSSATLFSIALTIICRMRLTLAFTSYNNQRYATFTTLKKSTSSHKTNPYSSSSSSILSNRIISNKRYSTSFIPSSMDNNSDNDGKNKENFNESSFITKQKELSKELLQQDNDNESVEILSKEEYLNHQKEIFNKFASFFSNDDEITPIEIRPAIRYVVKRFLTDTMKFKQKNNDDDDGDDDELSTIRLLDVGCGTGVLFPYIIEIINDLDIRNKVHITGLDLSNEMINKAKQRIEEVEYNTNQISFELINYDYIKWANNNSNNENKSKFDGVLMNAVFGNFYDLNQVISSTSKVLSNNGILSISHPLGSKFQEKLHLEDPNSVKHTLPSTKKELTKILHTYPLIIHDDKDITEKVDLFNHQKEIQMFHVYYTSLRKVNYSSLSSIMKFRGIVASGYGRGGKTLGVPTANLPETLFSSALENVTTGVYFGWAVIEQLSSNTIKPGRNTYHKAVVNIGYSPTFTNKENPVKIIEAHLILRDDEKDQMTDFYNETMRLQLIGFIRPEQKFDSFIELKNQIFKDINTATIALSRYPYSIFRSDVFFDDLCSDSSSSKEKKMSINNDDVVWIGNDGGGDIASWEFTQWDDVIGTLPVGKFL